MEGRRELEVWERNATHTHIETCDVSLFTCTVEYICVGKLTN
jgi:hypothetical protein